MSMDFFKLLSTFEEKEDDKPYNNKGENRDSDGGIEKRMGLMGRMGRWRFLTDWRAPFPRSTVAG